MKFLAFAALVLTAIQIDATETGTITLHFLQQPVGEEKYEIRRGDGGDITLTAAFEYTERGTTVPLKATLRMKSDYTPEEFRAEGRSYRPFSVDSHVLAQGERAIVRQFKETREMALPSRYFFIDGYSPLSAQMLLIRYWLAHDRPDFVFTVPAGDPDGRVTIAHAGRDRIRIAGRTLDLDRYTINNVVWGRESVWLDARRNFAAATTFTGGLPLEAIRTEYVSALPEFVRISVADRMKDLAEMTRANPPIQQGDYVINDATLVDGTGRAPVQDSVVIIRSGRIAAAGSRSEVPIPAGMRIVDARGHMLLPGLWDMHAHYTQIEWGPSYLAAGITTVRDCGGAFEFSTAVRDAIAKSGSLGPRLLLAALVDGLGPGGFGITRASNEAEARALVAKFKAAGVDQVKLYTLLTPDIVRALASEAHRLGMTVTGHVPRAMTVFEAVEAGMDHVSHLGSVAQAIRDDNSERAIRFFRERGTVVDPTMAWGELTGHPVEMPAVSFEPGMARAPYQLASLINTAGSTTVDRESFLQRQAEQLSVIRTLHKAGVPIVAGTDKALPGHSLHRELEFYVQAGLTPLDAIRSATIVAARAMGLEKDVGTIEAGKRADLILVNGNPLEDIRHIRRVTRVVTNGRMYDTETMWRIVGFK